VVGGTGYEVIDIEVDWSEGQATGRDRLYGVIDIEGEER
jgi:hypothetical protein